jgi:hypothetical protein
MLIRILGKVVIVWAAILALAILNGALRDVVVAEIVGGTAARVASGVILCLLIPSRRHGSGGSLSGRGGALARFGSPLRSYSKLQLGMHSMGRGGYCSTRTRSGAVICGRWSC